MLCLFAFGTQAKNNAAGPPSEDGPIFVEVGFLLGNINGINEQAETFDFEGVLSMHWHDDRLAFDPVKTGYDQLYYQGSYQFNEVFSGWWLQVYLANEAGRFDREAVMLRKPLRGIFITRRKSMRRQSPPSSLRAIRLTNSN
ncbi:MAG: hypothetical protein P8J17_10385 [Halioglobus sp.]|nr:hypothetical protein [Halioglobus sp.]